MNRPQHEFQAHWDLQRSRLNSILPEIRSLMEAAFATAEPVVPDSALDQNGLRDGIEIVQDYLKHNELGLALEHLCYIIDAANLPISKATYAVIEAAGTDMQIDPAYWVSFNPVTVSMSKDHSATLQEIEYST